jgi:hypothetical protein
LLSKIRKKLPKEFYDKPLLAFQPAFSQRELLKNMERHGKPIINLFKKFPKNIIFPKYFLFNRPENADLSLK